MNYTLTRNVKKLSAGQVVYSAMCYDNGCMVDDGTLLKFGQDNFRWVGGGHTTFVGFLNMGVHVFMYFYYFMSSFGPSVQKYLWWKRSELAESLANFKWMWMFQIFNHNAASPVCHLLHPCNFSHFHWLWVSQRIQLCHPLSWCHVLHPLPEFLHPVLHPKRWERE